MQMTYESYIQARAAVLKAARPSQKASMLNELADRWPELHYEMCMGEALMRGVPLYCTDQEVCHV